MKINPYINIFIRLQVISVVMFVFYAVFNHFFDLDEFSGYLWLFLNLPSVCSVLLLFILMNASKRRKEFLEIDEAFFIWTLSDSEWNTYLRLIKSKRKESFIEIVLIFSIGGILSSLLNLIPVSIIQGLGIGFILSFVGILIKYYYDSIQLYVTKEEDRIVSIHKNGLVVGYYVHFWDKSEGLVKSIHLSSFEDLPYLILEYEKTSYSKNVGYKRVSTEIIIPISEKVNETEVFTVLKSKISVK
jgi:hypothetical protein